MDSGQIETAFKVLDLLQKGIDNWETVAPFVKLIVYLTILFLFSRLFKKVAWAGKAMSYAVGASIFVNILSLSGFDYPWMQQWVEIFKYILIFWGLA